MLEQSSAMQCVLCCISYVYQHYNMISISSNLSDWLLYLKEIVKAFFSILSCTLFIVDVHLNYLCQSTARSDGAVFNTTRPIWEKNPFHSTYLAACRLTIMGTLNELWSNSQLNALKGMPRGPAWKASGVKCLFFKSAANVGCFQVCYCPAGFPFQPTPTALLMWRRVEGRGDGQEKTT